MQINFSFMLPKKGSEAPLFELPDQLGIIHALKQYRGSWVLIYFYPKDDTPGCTKEACMLRDNLPSFKKGGAVVLGISVDSVKSHARFAEKYDLPFTLLSDEKKEVVENYGVWGEKKFMGRTYMGTKRMSFLVDPEGVIAKVYEVVRPAEHAEEVVRDLEELKNA